MQAALSYGDADGKCSSRMLTSEKDSEAMQDEEQYRLPNYQVFFGYTAQDQDAKRKQQTLVKKNVTNPRLPPNNFQVKKPMPV